MASATNTAMPTATDTATATDRPAQDRQPAAPKQKRPSATPTRDRSNLPLPTQDHSQLPPGAEVKSDSLWIQFRQVGAAEIGVRWIIDANFIEAMDVWGPLGVDAEVCFDGTGNLLFLDATTSPRAQYWLNAYQRRDGKTCAHINRPGTVALMPAEHGTPLPPTATLAPIHPGSPSGNFLIPDSLDLSAPLDNCAISSPYTLNVRQSPAGHIMGAYLGEVTRAFARTPNWFMVDYFGNEGWVSAHLVNTSGDCG